jgi:hypothetical protein
VTDTLDELERLLKAGTPGPWWTPPAEQNDTQGLVFMGRDGGFDLRFSPLPKANAALIVAAINALPGLIESAQRAERLEAALRGIVESCQTIRPQGDNVAWSYADPVNPMNIVGARRIEAAHTLLKGT